MFGGLREKKGKGFERRREKTKMRERRDSVSVKTDLTLFIARGIHDLLFTLFIYFYYFIKKETLFYSPSNE